MSQTIVPPTHEAPWPADAPPLSVELQRIDRDLQRVRSERDGWLLAILGVSVMALACAVLFVIIGVRDHEGGAAASSAPTAIEATLSEFSIDLPVTEVAEGGSIEVTNTGALAHNLAVVGSEIRTANLNGNDSATLSLAGLAPGQYTMICEIRRRTASRGRRERAGALAGRPARAIAAIRAPHTTRPERIPVQLTHRRVWGRASRRSIGMATPHCSQVP